MCYIEHSSHDGVAPPSTKREGGGAMDTYQVLTLLLLSGNFLIALLTYIDRHK